MDRGGFSADLMVDGYIRVYETVVDKTEREDLRPWGSMRFLSGKPDHKVKRITVYPGHGPLCPAGSPPLGDIAWSIWISYLSDLIHWGIPGW
jgi:hypothetical protein